MLPKKAINEFKELYKDFCGVTLDFGDAEMKAENFLKLFSILKTHPDIGSEEIKREKEYGKK